MKNKIYIVLFSFTFLLSTSIVAQTSLANITNQTAWMTPLLEIKNKMEQLKFNDLPIQIKNELYQQLSKLEIPFKAQDAWPFTYVEVSLPYYAVKTTSDDGKPQIEFEFQFMLKADRGYLCLWRIRTSPGDFLTKFQTVGFKEVGTGIFFVDQIKLEGYVVNDLEIEEDYFKLSFPRAIVYLGQVTGKNVVMVCYGEGKATISPKGERAEYYFKKHKKGESDAFSFNRMYMCGSEESYKILENKELEPYQDANAEQQAYDLIDERLKGDWYQLVKPDGYLYVEFDSNENGWCYYKRHPYARKQISFGSRGVPTRTTFQYRIPWFEMFDKSVQALSRREREHFSPKPVTPTQHHLKGNLWPQNGTVQLEYRVEYKAEQKLVEPIILHLSQAIFLHTVIDSRHNRWAGYQKGALLWLYPPEPVKKGEQVQLTFVYEGDVVKQVQGDCYAFNHHDYWYPELPETLPRPAQWTYDLTVPPEYFVVAPGYLDKKQKTDLGRQFIYKSHKPAMASNIMIGRWEAAPELTRLCQGRQTLCQSVPVGLLKTMDKELRLADNTFDALDRAMKPMIGRLGAYPFDDLTLVDFPRGWHVDLPGVMGIGLSGFHTSAFPNTTAGFIAHMLAHQWFSHHLVYVNGDDKWMDEAFCELAAADIIRQTDGFNRFAMVTSDWQIQAQSALEKMTNARQIAGPSLYDTAWQDKDARLLTKKRGPIFLNYLAHVIGHDAFWSAVAELMKQPKPISTYDLMQKLSEAAKSSQDSQVTPEEVALLFEKYCYRGDYPQLELTYKLKANDDGSFKLTGDLVNRKGNEFVLLPLALIEADNSVKTVWIKSSVQKLVFEFKLDTRPAAVKVNDAAGFWGKVALNTPE